MKKEFKKINKNGKFQYVTKNKKQKTVSLEINYSVFFALSNICL